jgi:hypothetical protein
VGKQNGTNPIASMPLKLLAELRCESKKGNDPIVGKLLNLRK